MIWDELFDWDQEIRRYLPLSRPQAWGLTLWSMGVILAQSCGQATVAAFWADLLERNFDAMRQRLREFYLEATAKHGPQRREVDVPACFAGLLAWVLARWEGRELVLVLDPTSFKDRFVVLAVSVVFRGTAIPVAWRVVPAGQPGAWNPHWVALLERITQALPDDYFVLVLTDRGLYSRSLYEAIRRTGCHPLMRINPAGEFRPEGHPAVALSSLVPGPGGSYRGRGVAFKTNPLSCTLVAHWDAAYPAPWYVLTDVAPERVEARWYGLRAWIEQGFKDLKRGGLDWHLTRMEKPERVERMWLVLAVASVRLVAVGGASEDAARPAPPPAPPHAPSGTSEPSEPSEVPTAATPRATPRRLSVFRLGQIKLLTWLLKGGHPAQRPPLSFVPDPLPAAFARAG